MSETVHVNDKRPNLTYTPLQDFVEKYGLSDGTIGQIWLTMRHPPHCIPHETKSKSVHPSMELCQALKMNAWWHSSGVTLETIRKKLKEFAE